ncbi:MAG: hypothetical protein CM15mV52_1070 [uncultured marine virus]|nr:MAG: hypothetical protein CM15mV52_1070 [uncultured marine virus]
MKAANINNTYSASNKNTPGVVKLPMNQFFNMKFYVDISANKALTSGGKETHILFFPPFSSRGLGMRFFFKRYHKRRF